jgi:hypothetical protein
VAGSIAQEANPKEDRAQEARNHRLKKGNPMSERTQFHELPEFWQQRIRDLKHQNHNLRVRNREFREASELSPCWEKTVKDLRGDCKRYRLALRKAEQRIAELEARNA